MKLNVEKTIWFFLNNRNTNEITMFAENLGLIAPNTALMRIHDGKKQYDLRISSTLKRMQLSGLKERKKRMNKAEE